MPFQSDTRCGTFMVQLNVSVICEELQRMLEKEYTQDIDEGSMFWSYVYEIEFEFNCFINSNPTKPISFWDWFIDNYNSIYAFNQIEDNFVDEE